MLHLPLGYHNCRFVFALDGIQDEMGFSIAFAPHGDGNVAEITAEAAVAAMFSSAFWTEPTVSSEWTWLTTEDTQMLADGPFTWIDPTQSPGSATQTLLPPNNAMLVRKITNLGGATNRGRLYIPPFKLAEANVTNAGVILTAAINTIQGQLDALWTAFTTAGLDPVLLHTDPLETPTPVLAFALQTTIATQRRRLR
jgi:hypothetical protein